MNLFIQSGKACLSNPNAEIQIAILLSICKICDKKYTCACPKLNTESLILNPSTNLYAINW